MKVQKLRMVYYRLLSIHLLGEREFKKKKRKKSKVFQTVVGPTSEESYVIPVMQRDVFIA